MCAAAIGARSAWVFGSPDAIGVRAKLSPKHNPWCNNGRTGHRVQQHTMKNLFEAGKLLLLDMASTFFFLILVLLTHNLTLSVVLGMALWSAQIGCQSPRKLPHDPIPGINP